MIEWIQNHWLEIVGVLWGIDQLLKVISQLTPTKVDDNISDYLGKFLAKFFPKK